jgi:uncharacterized protein
MRAMILAVFLAVGPAMAQDEGFFTLAGGDVNGNYFATARAICSVVNTAARGAMRCSPEATPGSVYNLDGLASGEIDFAIVQSDWLVAARDGTGVFASQGPLPDLRGVIALYDEQITLLVGKDAEVTRPAELAGLRVDLGPPASGRRATSERILAIIEVDPTDFGMLSELPNGGAIDELCAGRLDAVILVTGHPDLSVARAIGECGARVVPFVDGAHAALIAQTGLYVASEIPANTYGAGTTEVPTYAVTATLVTRAMTDGPDPRLPMIITAMRQAKASLARRVRVLAALDLDKPWRDSLGVAAHPDIPPAP